MKSLTTLLLAAAATMTLGCVSSSAVGYTDGWVKTSPVSYSFSGPPVFDDMKGRTYRVENGGKATTDHVPVFDQHGMQATAGQADVRVRIELQDARHGKPGAVKLGKHWYPSFTVTVPYVTSVSRGGRQLTSQNDIYQNILTFKGQYRFESRSKAVEALDAIRKLGQKGIDEKARNSAMAEATKGVSAIAAGLFKDRSFNLNVPVVRSAAGLDLEQCYTMLAEAKGPDDVKQALAAYEQFGTDQRKPDGTPNRTANYGVACGIAASKLMLRDLRGAWDVSKVAAEFEPSGQEANEIRYVIYQQEKITGQKVIPEEDRAKIAEKEKLGGAFKAFFARPGR